MEPHASVWRRGTAGGGVTAVLSCSRGTRSGSSKQNQEKMLLLRRSVLLLAAVAPHRVAPFSVPSAAKFAPIAPRNGAAPRMTVVAAAPAAAPSLLQAAITLCEVGALVKNRRDAGRIQPLVDPLGSVVVGTQETAARALAKLTRDTDDNGVPPDDPTEEMPDKRSATHRLMIRLRGGAPTTGMRQLAWPGFTQQDCSLFAYPQNRYPNFGLRLHNAYQAQVRYPPGHPFQGELIFDPASGPICGFNSIPQGLPRLPHPLTQVPGMGNIDLCAMCPPGTRLRDPTAAGAIATWLSSTTSNVVLKDGANLLNDAQTGNRSYWPPTAPAGHPQQPAGRLPYGQIDAVAMLIKSGMRCILPGCGRMLSW